MSRASRPALARPDAGDAPRLEPMLDYLLRLRDTLCGLLEEEESAGRRFAGTRREGVRGGFTEPRMLEGGDVLERAAVHVTRARLERLPRSSGAAARAGGVPCDAASLSAIVHPRNPHAPSAHLNLRFFLTDPPEGEREWWLGGGYDLSPTYGYEEDARDWHRTARDACAPFGSGTYERFKAACDAYFALPHRGETRGVGGLFFDAVDRELCGGFTGGLELARSVGDSFAAAYLPILRRRKETPYGERERAFQLFRRGRYVEFNLLYDRGTRFGLEAGVDASSLLSSLPPAAAWALPFRPEPGSPEDELSRRFLRPRAWA